MLTNTCFLYRIHPTCPAILTQGAATEEATVIEKHFSYLSDLTEKGVVLLAGRTLNTDPSSFGIVIPTAESEATVSRIMPAELFPFRNAL